jgi:solute carrier family 29 (equilibrative nucleoside transporter) protein 4
MASFAEERQALIDGIEEMQPATSPPKPAPLDRAVYGICVLLGVGFLTPWNVIINSLDYLANLYPAADPVGRSIGFYISAATTYPGLPLLFLMVRYGNLVPAHVRVVFGFLLCTAVLVLMPILAPLSSTVPILLAVVLGVSQVLLQSSLIGVTSLLPPAYSQGFMMGQGLSGVLASVGQIVVTGAAASSGGGSAPVYVFFGLGAAITLACVAGMLRLRALPMSKRAMESAAVGGGGGGGGGAPQREADEGADEKEDGALLGGAEGKAARARPSIISILKRTWVNQLAVFTVFVTTFLCVGRYRQRRPSARVPLPHARARARTLPSRLFARRRLFPGVLLSRIPYRGGLGPAGSYLSSSGWWSIILLAIFNAFDTVGRTLPSRKALAAFAPQRALLWAALARFAFMPFFLGIAGGWAPWLGDVAALLGTVVYSVSNGFLASLALMRAPQGVEPGEEQETAGFLLSVMINVGILVGSQLALLLK